MSKRSAAQRVHPLPPSPRVLLAQLVQVCLALAQDHLLHSRHSAHSTHSGATPQNTHSTTHMVSTLVKVTSPTEISSQRRHRAPQLLPAPPAWPARAMGQQLSAPTESARPASESRSLASKLANRQEQMRRRGVGGRAAHLKGRARSRAKPRTILACGAHRRARKERKEGPGGRSLPACPCAAGHSAERSRGQKTKETK